MTHWQFKCFKCSTKAAISIIVVVKWHISTFGMAGSSRPVLFCTPSLVLLGHGAGRLLTSKPPYLECSHLWAVQFIQSRTIDNSLVTRVRPLGCHSNPICQERVCRQNFYFCRRLRNHVEKTQETQGGFHLITGQDKKLFIYVLPERRKWATVWKVFVPLITFPLRTCTVPGSHCTACWAGGIGVESLLGRREILWCCLKSNAAYSMNRSTLGSKAHCVFLRVWVC